MSDIKKVIVNGYQVNYEKLNETQCKAKIYDFGVPIDEKIVDIKFEDITTDKAARLVNQSLSEGK